jgi:hypothetical protein
LSFIKGRGISDALRALVTRESVHDKMGRADQARIHGGSGLDGDELVHERLVKATAKLTEGGGQHKMGLRGGDAVFSEASGIHDRKVRTKAVADIVIGGAQFMLE